MAGKKVGRPRMYSTELAAELCSRLATGEPMTQIVKDDHMPASATVYRWLTENQEFKEMYESARKDGAHSLVSQIQEIADSEPLAVFDEHGNKRYDPGSISYNKLRVEARKWLAAKYLPRVYGERVTHAGDADNPVAMSVDTSVFDTLLQSIELRRQADK